MEKYTVQFAASATLIAEDGNVSMVIKTDGNSVSIPVMVHGKPIKWMDDSLFLKKRN